MNTTRLKHRLTLLVPFCYIAFLLFGLIGHMTRNDEAGLMIIIITVITWIMNKMIAEAFTASTLWRRLDDQDKK